MILQTAASAFLNTISEMPVVDYQPDHPTTPFAMKFDEIRVRIEPRLSGYYHVVFVAYKDKEPIAESQGRQIMEGDEYGLSLEGRWPFRVEFN